MAMDAREEKILCAELDNLGFKWERTRRGHIKAVAPDGKTFTFSTGGYTRTTLNQRSMLNSWKRANLSPSEEEEVEVVFMNNDDHGLIILEEMEPGVAFVAHDVANKTDLTKEQAANAITYLVSMGMLDLVERENGFSYRIPIDLPKEEEEVALSPAAVSAIEAMVAAVRTELGGEDMDELKIANEALKSAVESARAKMLASETRANGLEKEVTRLREIEKKFLELKKAFGN